MIKACGLAKNFSHNGAVLPVIRPLDLQIPKGSVTAIRGRSGSGKTTLLTLLSGLDRPSAGRVAIDDLFLDTLSESGLARFRNHAIGFVFQDFHLLPGLTAKENVMFPAELAGVSDAADRATALLHHVGLSDRLDHLPRKLSGGEQQRVAICRSLINEPAVLFADEPTGNLDSTAAGKVLDLLMEVRETTGVTLVVVTHSDDVAKRAERVITLSDGEVVDDTDR